MCRRSLNARWSTTAHRTSTQGLPMPRWKSPIVHAKMSKFRRELRKKRTEWVEKAASEKGLDWLRACMTDEVNDANVVEEEPEEVSEMLRDMQAEAKRIIHADLQINVGSLNSKRDIPHDWTAIDQKIRNTLKYIRQSKHGLRSPPRFGGLKEDVGVYMMEDLVPGDLKRVLVEEMTALKTTQPVDIEPGTGGKVFNVIDPSLRKYSSLIGCSTAYRSSPCRRTDLARLGMPFWGQTSTWKVTRFPSRFSVVATPFLVSPDGLSVETGGPINGVSGCRRELGDVLERALLMGLPLMERVAAFKFEDQDPSSVKRWRARSASRYKRVSRDEWDDILRQQATEKEFEERNRRLEDEEMEKVAAGERQMLQTFTKMEESMAGSPLQGKQLKIIVKAFDIVLKSGEEYEDIWQYQGFPHEQIVMSLLYHYEGDLNAFAPPQISFRRARKMFLDFPSKNQDKPEDFVTNFRSLRDRVGARIVQPLRSMSERTLAHADKDYPSDWENEVNEDGVAKPMTTSRLNPFITEGSVSFGGGDGGPKMVAFPNWLQSKLRVFGPKEGFPEATHKFLQFCVVFERTWDNATMFLPDRPSFQNPIHTLINVRSVPCTVSQPASSLPNAVNLGTIHFLLPYICKKLTHGKNLPPELVSLIYEEMESGIDREEAERLRWEMKEERTIDVVNLEPYDNEVLSLHYDLHIRKKIPPPGRIRWGDEGIQASQYLRQV